eukprot:TRINITY_DN5952_c0_g1_i2.p1 TRINITY_DN5952_c0_g1~~TRINITY_DN5952_c0_g1_i2.p1  ORF type:complete len:177 (+),score=23.66 TRINITY_DN5952_c0_g1_i2:73-603(+)
MCIRDRVKEDLNKVPFEKNGNSGLVDRKQSERKAVKKVNNKCTKPTNKPINKKAEKKPSKANAKREVVSPKETTPSKNIIKEPDNHRKNSNVKLEEKLSDVKEDTNEDVKLSESPINTSKNIRDDSLIDSIHAYNHRFVHTEVNSKLAQSKQFGRTIGSIYEKGGRSFKTHTSCRD